MIEEDLEMYIKSSYLNDEWMERNRVIDIYIFITRVFGAHTHGYGSDYISLHT